MQSYIVKSTKNRRTVEVFLTFKRYDEPVEVIQSGAARPFSYYKDKVRFTTAHDGNRVKPVAQFTLAPNKEVTEDRVERIHNLATKRLETMLEQ